MMPDRLRLFRTTAFKLSAVFLAVFTVFAAFLIGYIARNTTEILQAQMGKAVDAELSVMSEQYRRGGIQGLGRFIDVRSYRPGASLYLLTDPQGTKIAGNVESVPQALLSPADPGAEIVPYVRIEEDESETRHAALVRVVEFPAGYRVLVGRDVSETEEIATLVRRSMIWTVALMVALGLLSWIFVSRRVLKRIDSIADTSRRIIAGDLSGRLEVTGTDDEFDRLAESLNIMLERIERLMLGLKQMSDNIAHDLKTPLTRMRNRVEAALTLGQGGADRQLLQATIDDADQLIRTFNALLTIARVEAGVVGCPVRIVRCGAARTRRVRALRAAGGGGGRVAAARGRRAGDDAGEPRADQPGAGEPRRQRGEICGEGSDRPEVVMSVGEEAGG